MTLEVIGAGLGRTGTMSLKLALEQLGFGPCHHMMELFAGPDPESLTAKWLKVAEREPIDWDDVFAGYRSTVDWPSSAYWRELADHYPSAKVILSVRDPDTWFDSTQATIFRPGRKANQEAPSAWDRMEAKIISDGTFGGATHDRAHATAVFSRHNRDVIATIPADRLLVYEAHQGWGPLCAFLGVPVPDAPYPSSNSTEEFKDRVARRNAESEAKKAASA